MKCPPLENGKADNCAFFLISQFSQRFHKRLISNFYTQNFELDKQHKNMIKLNS